MRSRCNFRQALACVLRLDSPRLSRRPACGYFGSGMITTSLIGVAFMPPG